MKIAPATATCFRPTSPHKITSPSLFWNLDTTRNEKHFWHLFRALLVSNLHSPTSLRRFNVFIFLFRIYIFIKLADVTRSDKKIFIQSGWIAFSPAISTFSWIQNEVLPTSIKKKIQCWFKCREDAEFGQTRNSLKCFPLNVPQVRESRKLWLEKSEKILIHDHRKQLQNSITKLRFRFLCVWINRKITGTLYGLYTIKLTYFHKKINNKNKPHMYSIK
jgi:hypothetical protein